MAGPDASTRNPDHDLSSVPVAVLTSRETASAAEAVAIAFIGRASTRSFGTPSFGVPTANSTYELHDRSALALTTAVGIDRIGNEYAHPLDPDVNVPPTPEPDAARDVATAWLETIRTCR